MSNASILQNNNQTLLDNNLSIDALIKSINNLSEGGSEDLQELATAFIQRTFTEYNNDTITSIGNSAFRACANLTKVSFSKATNTGEYAFYDCPKLTDVNFPVATTVSSQCFRGCTGLTEATFPEATFVGAYAFYQDPKLTTVRLPKVKNIGISVFNGCTNLTTLIIEQADTPCTLASNALASSGIANGAGYIYVPDSRVDAYKSATNWSAYAAQIKPLSELEG